MAWGDARHIVTTAGLFGERVQFPMPPARPITDIRPTCQNPNHEGRPCTRTLAAYLTRPWSLRCKRCGYENARD